MTKKVKNLVVDTTAFIKNAQLQDIAENIYTVQEVVEEVKNNKQIGALFVLPYDLKVIQPDPENIQIINEFSKKTGDFAVLSVTDVKVLALTYQLEKQFNGVAHLKKEPTIAKTVYTQKPEDKANRYVYVAGFYNPEDASQHPEEQHEEIAEQLDENDESESDTNESSDNENSTESITDEELVKKFGSIGFNNIANQEADDILQKVAGTESDQESDSAIEEDNEGWITPGNIQNVKKNFGADVLEDKEVDVACITTDFAMQNVLKQMGLNVTSLDGRIIKHVRTFILRCYTCFKTTSNMMKLFCPKCGHKTLKRVSVSVNEKGEKIVHLNPRKQITTKFKNQPLPKLKGGKHATNPLLFEDQNLPQQRLAKKAMLKTDALDENYTASYSPFVTRDIDSRSAKLRSNTNIKQWMQNYEYDNMRRGYKKKK